MRAIVITSDLFFCNIWDCSMINYGLSNDGLVIIIMANKNDKIPLGLYPNFGFSLGHRGLSNYGPVNPRVRSTNILTTNAAATMCFNIAVINVRCIIVIHCIIPILRCLR